MLRKWVRKVMERLSGRRIVYLGPRSFALLDTEERVAHGWFHYETQVRHFVEKLGISTILDVGANEGQFARGVRSFFEGEIWSFEPSDGPFGRLSQIAGGDGRWHVLQQALGAEQGEGILNVTEESVFGSFLSTNLLAKRRFGAEVDVTGRQKVVMERLDQVLKREPSVGIGSRIFMKLDTQGYDLEVFRGAAGIMDRVFLLQAEISLLPIYDGMPHWTESVQVFEEAGFSVVGLFPVTRDEDCVIEYDCLMVRRPGDDGRV